MSRDAIIAAARGWIGTPYRHQASCNQVGADCLGLIRGVWRELYGAEPAPVPDGCDAALIPFEPDELTTELLVALGSLSREEQPEQEGIGRMVSDKVVLTCG